MKIVKGLFCRTFLRGMRGRGNDDGYDMQNICSKDI